MTSVLLEQSMDDMTKILRILTMPEARMRVIRQLSIVGTIVGAVAAALLCIVAISGQI